MGARLRWSCLQVGMSARRGGDRGLEVLILRIHARCWSLDYLKPEMLHPLRCSSTSNPGWSDGVRDVKRWRGKRVAGVD